MKMKKAIGMMSAVVEPMSISRPFPSLANRPANLASACQFEAAASKGFSRAFCVETSDPSTTSIVPQYPTPARGDEPRRTAAADYLDEFAASGPEPGLECRLERGAREIAPEIAKARRISQHGAVGSGEEPVAAVAAT